MARKVLLDTDIGSDVDDALALAVLLAEPDALELVAVTTVAKVARRRADQAARLLGLAGRSDVPVYVGCDEAVLRPGRFVWREIEDRGLPAGPDAPVREAFAPEEIVRRAKQTPGLEIVAIGPMTNLAHAVALEPRLPRYVERLTIMGGHVREVRCGELLCEPGIDYNLCSDPEASMAVLGAGFRTRLVTADVTLQCWLTEADLARLDAAAGLVPRCLAGLIRIWTPFQREIFTGIGGTLAPDNVAFLHDPLTVLSLVDESALRFETLRVLPTIERGTFRTLEVPPGGGAGFEAEVATGVAPARVAASVLERLVSL